MINATKSLVYFVDLDGNILNLNTQGARMFDKYPEEMLNQNFSLFMHKNDCTRLKIMLDAIVETKELINYQRERGERYLDVNLYPIVNKNNKVDRRAKRSRGV